MNCDYKGEEHDCSIVCACGLRLAGGMLRTGMGSKGEMGRLMCTWIFSELHVLVV